MFQWFLQYFVLLFFGRPFGSLKSFTKKESPILVVWKLGQIVGSFIAHFGKLVG